MKYITHKPTKKDFTIWVVVLALLILIPVLSLYNMKSDHPAFLIVIIAIPAFLIINLAIRRSLAFKKYFTSPINLLTSKLWSEKTFDIPKDLMFEKIIEVIHHSKFKLVAIDPDKFEILAITGISLKSWGENLYISLETVGDETTMKFCTVTLFQIYAWGKNEKNVTDLLNEIEDSLIV